MSKKHFSWLAAVTLLAAAIAFLLPGQTADDSEFEKAPLLPGLEARVNDIDWLRISAEGAVVATAARRDGQWVIEEAAGYRADWPQLHQLLSALAAATVLEAKTDNPDYYDRLGVEDPAAAGANSVLIEFGDSTGLPAVIAGNRAQGREGQYVRLADSARSVLIDGELDIARTAEDWLERGIVDIAGAEVVEAAVTHADGQSVVIRKISAADENFELLDIPDGMEAKSAYYVNALADGFSALELEGVAPAAGIDWSGSTAYRVVTADGLNVEAALVTLPGAGENGETHWIRLDAGLYTTAIGGAEGAAPETTARAEALNQRVAGWAYRIPQYKYAAVVKRMDDLVQPVTAEQ